MTIEPVAWMHKDEDTGMMDEFVEAYFVEVTKGQFPFDDPIPVYSQSAIDELKRQLAEKQQALELAEADAYAKSRVACNYYEKLAEREAVIEELRDLAIWMTGACPFADHDYFVSKRHLLLSGTDHTALDEAIKQAKVEVLEEADKRIDVDYACECGVPCECFSAHDVKRLMRRMADEIRREG